MSYGKRITWLESQRTPVVLFDMDGTLTEPRGPLEKQLISPLENLSDIAEIGIVTGSDFEYLKQQVGFLMNQSKIRYKLHLLPCNGTKYYPPPKTATDNHELRSEENMAQTLGQEKFSSLMTGILEVQAHISKLRNPLTGHYVDYRGSMINWCPIGRNATKAQREEFISMDLHRTPTLREKYLTRLRIKMDYITRNIVCKIGGDTSFDIYPVGWDKTYALKHFKNHKKIFFVGDRCQENGNDYEIYNTLGSKGYETKSPEQTEDIIKEIIKIIKSN